MRILSHLWPLLQPHPARITSKAPTDVEPWSLNIAAPGKGTKQVCRPSAEIRKARRKARRKGRRKNR